MSVEDWELLSQVAQAYRGLTDAFMDRVDMHRAQGMLLCRLFAHEGMTQSEIADQLGVQGATVTNMLQRMEEAGYVERQRDAEDNRLVRVFLTDKGREKERSITEQIAQLEAAIFDGFSVEERATLRRLLAQILNNMMSAQIS